MHSLSRKAEDYLEAILNASLEKGYARTKDIARELCIQPPTVVEMVRKLDHLGLIKYRKYEGVTLTPEGRRIAEIVKDRHETLQSFLEIFKVPEAIATQDACMMEHELSPDSIGQIRMFLAFLKEDQQAASVMKNFETFTHVKKAKTPL